MAIFFLILLIAASPVIAVFIFSEIMSAKEENKTHDMPRKLTKTLAWLIFGLISCLLLYGAITDSPLHLNLIFQFINAGAKFLQ